MSGSSGGRPSTQELKQQRLERQKRIEKYLPKIKRNVVPELSEEECLDLLGDIKTEGNDLFNDQQYDDAANHYTGALFLGRMLQQEFNINVEVKLMSSLFTNRAFCCIKMERYDAACADCDYAVTLDFTNIKGYYRKAQCLIEMQQYAKAQEVGFEGQQVALALHKTADAKKFDELLQRIPGQQQRPAAPQPKPAAAKPPTQQTQQQQHQLPNGKAATVSLSNLPDSKNGGGQATNGADISWLEGTNAKKDMKKKQHSKKSKKQQKKKQQVKTKSKIAYSGQFESLANESSSEASDDSSAEEDEDDDDEDEEDEGAAEELSWAEQCPPETTTQQYHMPKTVPQKHAPKFDTTYGLDDFGLPSNSRMSSSNPALSSAAPRQPAAATMSKATAAALKYDFAVLTPPVPLQYPFDSLYDFSLACEQCYSYIGYGPDGYVADPKLQHKCPRYTLLVRDKGSFGTPWMKIRPRPQNPFSGRYRMCTQFEKSETCRIGEPRCSFGHSKDEVALWELDRKQQFSIEEFIEEQRKYVFSGQMRKDWGNTVIEPQNTSVQPAPPQPPQQQHQPTAPPKHTAPKQGLLPHPQPPKQGLLPHPQPPKQAFLPHPQPPKQGLLPQPPRAPSVTPQLMSKFSFPLASSHTFKLVCNHCFRRDPSVHRAYYITDVEHECSQDVFAVQKLGSQRWIKIRERLNHRVFPGKYALCRNYINDPPLPCNRAEELCSFAHSMEEQRIWGMEKDDQFSVVEFINQNRSGQTMFGISELLQRYGGMFHFLCHHCFFGQPAVIATQHQTDPQLCSQGKHPWQNSKQLMHVKVNGPTMQVEPIAPRPFQHLQKQAFYNMCHGLRFCVKRRQGHCNYAHSKVERDVWLVERDTDATPEDIERESKVIAKQLSQKQQGTAPQQQAAPATAAKPAGPQYPKCPFRVICVCAPCYKNGIKSVKDPKRDDRCSNAKNNGHMWSVSKMYVMVLSGSIKEVRPLPDRLPKYANFIICHHVLERGKCTYVGQRRCQFAHSDEERQMWTYMFTNKINELEKLVEVCDEQFQATVKKPIAKGQSVIEAAPAAPWKHTPATPMLPFELLQNVLYCQYCSVQCNSSKQWDQHCAGDRHMMNVNSDKDHQWNFRQPPWGVSGGQYRLCSRHANNRQCQYSNVPELYNMCKFAHSQEEQDEWQERWEWREMKRDMARKDHVFSYMEALLDDFEKSDAPISVMTEEIPGVQISCDKPLTLFNSNKFTDLLWTFTVQSSCPLEKVALLYNKDRLHFALNTGQAEADRQIAPGNVFSQGDNTYSVQVQFAGGLFGSFMQWLVLDFGNRPVLVRKLNVELGTPVVQHQVQKLRQDLSFNRWTDENRVIVRFSDSALNEVDAKLLKQYRSPASAQQVVTHESLATLLNKHNYKHKLHSLLHLEEITRHRIISSYNLQADAELTTSVTNVDEGRGMIFARPGELFARVPLGEQLSEDTNAGKLILSGVKSVLVAPQHSSTNKVYEAEIVSKENFDYEGRGRDYVYLCLSQSCVIELELEAGEKCCVEIQFVMNRLAFCQMHYAVDQLRDTEVVFPDCSKVAAAYMETHDLMIRSTVLNDDQMKVVRHIAADRRGCSPPLIVYGPFGTGKTETLAQAAMLLLREKPDARILICTHSNSAADLYITKHFDAYVKKNRSVEVLRMYFAERRINTVNNVVRKYCLLSPDQSCFIKPAKEHILTKQVVLTTLSTSLLLSELRVAGYFTHIFLDEGGQALETEAIMPLSLAAPNTCIVMAGDYMQMGPKIYSKEARRQHLDQSLLQRLYRHYEVYQGHLGVSHSPLNVLLTRNYRSKMEIVRFLSAIFYDGPNNLVAAQEQPNVDGLIPLMFYAAQGKEYLDVHDTSYYNPAEVEEVVLVVENLWSRWPVEEWGPRQADLIGVITPYAKQVQCIRTALRQKSRELGRVTVERVMNVPGKEFRAVILSTVRTRHMIDDPSSAAAASSLNTSECDGDSADFGFLSDQKLLNTALTRAQSFVAVVGDPVALCSVGGCVTLWRAYLKHCSNLKSIVPSSVTLDSVRKQVNNISLSQQGGNLAELNVLADENAQGHAPARTQQQVQPLQLVDSAAQGGMVDRELASHHITEDTVLQMLQADVQLRQPGKVMLLRKSAMVVMTTDSAEASAESAASSEEEEEENVNITYTAQELLGRAQSEPQKYVVCSIHTDGTHGLYGRPINKDYPLARIHIGSWQNCTGAFIDDEAVIEVFDEKITLDKEEVSVGKVAVITRRSRGKTTVAVCRPAAANHNLMIPVNERLPPIHTIVSKQHTEKLPSRSVLVYGMKNAHLSAHHYEAVDNKKLFVVRYLKYEAKLSCNVGIVVGVLPVGKDLSSTEKIVDTDSCVQREFSAAALAEVQGKYPAGFTIPADGRRLNYSSKPVFTVSREGATVLQNAFSVELRRDGVYIVAVHVADVEYFVKQGDRVDQEAVHRSSASPHSPLMLPERLSTDLCSLVLGQDRLALSLFFNIDSSGTILEVRPVRSVIRVHQNIHYTDAEKVLTEQQHEVAQEMSIAVQILYSIACTWRRQRLGNASTSVDAATDTPRADIMVEESLLTANHNVAQFVAMNNVGMLCRQLWPAEAAVKKWREEHPAVHMLCPSLLWPHTAPAHSCQCEDVCQCAAADEHILTISIDRHVWSQLLDVARSGDDAKIQQLVLTAEKHPHLAAAKAALDKLMAAEEYILMAEDCPPQLWYHTGLHMEEYAQFTSPITSYADLVVHRAMINCMEKQEQQPYSREQLQLLCTQLTQVHRNTAQHEQDIATARMAHRLQAEPVVCFPVVQNSSRSGIELLFPSSSHIPALQVALVEMADWDSGELKMELSVYDNEHPTLAAPAQVTVSAQPYEVKLHREEWMMLVKAARSFQPQHLSALVQYFESNSATLVNSKVNSTECEIPLVQQHSKEESVCALTADISAGQLLKVQVGGSMKDGMLRPQVQLLYVTPSHALCVCHVTDPLSCFVPDLVASTAQSAAKTSYRDVESYKSSWQPVIALEAVQNAVSDSVANSGKVVRNLPIVFKENRRDALLGMQQSLFSKLDYQGAATTAYVCVRSEPKDDVAAWIGHGVVTETQAKGAMTELHVNIRQQNMSPPTQQGILLVTLQLLPTHCKYSCMEQRLQDLDAASELSKCIALGRSPPTLDASYLRHAKEVVGMSVCSGLPVGNQTQDIAVEKALTNPFTVIKGGPGTGKTLTLVKIVTLLVHLNKRVSVGDTKKPQVLLVAPTEQCLDKITGVLEELKSECPRIARVYGPKQQPSAPAASSTTTPVFADYTRLLSVPSAIQQADVVLATVTATALPPVIHNISVGQVVVESGDGVSEQELMMTLAACREHLRHVIVSGDIHQAASSAHRSLLERYHEQGVALNTHYRMHVAIAAFPSQQWYSHALSTCGRGDEQKKASTLKIWPSGKDKPIMFVDVSEGEEHGVMMQKLCNSHEAAVVARVASQLVWRSHVRPGDLAVLSLYPAQAQLIQTTLHDKNIQDISVLPVSSSRGCEWDYVVLSTVRVQPASLVERHPSSEWKQQRLGLAADPGLINLGVSRARKGLIILGCQRLLKADPTWRRLLKHYAEQQKILPASELSK